ncbi:type II toxin-antitoxin system VapC family toxin [Geotalea uraniireducens]|uniref:PilT protein domain protein n=1 Tax=Geotalea uraniireducens (strain Rf4) TaxID=351605 RepID=A5G4B6_GEOUR|nr:type II toxin-antitoxin system VapC family toxin [Geotalea uraniireducens]ABQ26634.1 PilT protein domain protein [Geotalea uraniireducens Rf4]
MRILLDTHIYLWWLDDSPQLSMAARTMIQEAETVYISSATLWEAVIKIGLGKLEADPAELVAGIRASGFEPLPITPEHALALPGLANHHKDPFDRMLIAQAISEPLRLVTMDGVLSAYSELVIQV